MVMRHGAEQVVNDVRVADMVLEVVDDESVVAVNGRESAVEERPFCRAVVGSFDVGVVQEGDDDKPCVGDEERSEVVFEDGGEGGLSAPVGEDCRGNDAPDVGKNDTTALTSFKDGCSGKEVGSPSFVVLAHVVEPKVEGPADDANYGHGNDVNQKLVNRSVVPQRFIVVRGVGVFGWMGRKVGEE